MFFLFSLIVYMGGFIGEGGDFVILHDERLLFSIFSHFAPERLQWVPIGWEYTSSGVPSQEHRELNNCHSIVNLVKALSCQRFSVLLNMQSNAYCQIMARKVDLPRNQAVKKDNTWDCYWRPVSLWRWNISYYSTLTENTLYSNCTVQYRRHNVERIFSNLRWLQTWLKCAREEQLTALINWFAKNKKRVLDFVL